MAASKLFAQVVPGDGKAPYALTASIVELRVPSFGGSMTSELEVGWSLQRDASAEPVLRKLVRTSHTAGISDALSGATRARLTLEGATRKNIEQVLQEIARLPP